MGVYDYFVCFCHCGYDSCSCLSDLGIYASDKRRTQSDSNVYPRIIHFVYCRNLFWILFVIFHCARFLTNMSAGQFEMMFTADNYFRFMVNLVLPFGFLFEMPLVVMLLTRLGILNSGRLAKARRVSYFFLVVVSIMITPPDFISDILVIIP